MSVEAHDIKGEVKKYWFVFTALLVFTVLTVAASNLQTGVTLGVIIALIIATVKGSLVACHFMHLTSEKKLVYYVLILAVVFLAAMMFLICFSYNNIPEGAVHVS